MELKKLTDRIYYLPSEERTDRPVLGYIKGDKYSLAVDAGNSAEHLRLFYNQLKALKLRLPDFTVITHWHWDHTFGMHAAAGKTIAGHLTNNKLNEVQGWAWTDEAMAGRLASGEDIENCDRCIRLEYPDRTKVKVVKADIEFSRSISIDLGGVHCDVREFTAPHSNDSVFVHIPEEKTVFIGDADCGDFYTNHGNYDKAKTKEMIRELEKIDFNILLPGHDVPQNRLEAMNFLKGELENKSTR